MVELGVIQNASIVGDAGTVRDVVALIERSYMQGQISSFLSSESERMFDILAARTFSIFEQVNQRLAVLEDQI